MRMDSPKRRRTNRGVSPWARPAGGALFAVAVLLWMLGETFADTTIRVLLLDNTFSKQPQKEEKVERLGTARGDVLLSGLKYSGHIEIWKGQNGLYIVNEIALEDYIKGVVSAEVGSSWDLEALKAQAVVARTYALYQKMNNVQPQVPYHLTSSVLHQVYRTGSISANVVRAVDDTRGEVLTYAGKPIIAYYHSTSCEATEDPEEIFGKSYPYLRSVQADCDLSPYYLWERKIPIAELEKSLNIRGIKEVIIDTYTAANRARQFRIISDQGEYFIPAKDVRRQLGWDRLPSTLITSITRTGDSCVFEGKGYGHGVGMCQWTALKLAKTGLGYRDILSRFYPGTVIRLYEAQ